MEKNNPLLPFAFSTLLANERSALSTDPREKHVIDENASSMYHTRSGTTVHKGPVLAAVPSMKRKMGASFTEKDDVKRRDYDDFWGTRNSDDSGANSPQHASTAAPPDGAIPSSPPVQPHMSEFDVSTSNYTIPDSPVHAGFTSPVKTRLHQSSEADFGIDQFNRFKLSSYNHSTDPDIEERHAYHQSQFNRAREIILRAFEDVSPSVSLEGMGLSDVPDEVKDLNNLVIFDDRPTQLLHQLYLTNNKLKSLNPALFKFTKLNVLSLRLNKILQLPPSIRDLRNLTDLNLASNRLQYLPPLILQLPRLQTFRAGPNPYIAVTDDAVAVDEQQGPDRCLKFVAPIKFAREERFVPSLKTYCLDAIARYDVSYNETKSWKRHTPKIYHPLIAEAILKGKLEYTCNECNMIIVEPAAEALEWWDILQNKDIPIKREFCSGKCARAYDSRRQKYFTR